VQAILPSDAISIEDFPTFLKSPLPVTSIYCFYACVNTTLGIYEIMTSREFYLSKSYRSAKLR